ncbi:MAG TPA: DUF4870 domain-containing protein [Phycisphaerae bacterium]|nr:DUF4870 domain-containing protein [Phycisphaerae bacterium]
MTDTPPPAPTNPTPDYNAGTAPVPDAADVEKNKVMGILAYLGILVLVPILAAKDSPFARYHANQGLILLLTAIVGWIPLMILTFIPIIGCIAAIILLCWWLGVLVMMILGIINAANGKMVPLPVIGNLFTLIK